MPDEKGNARPAVAAAEQADAKEPELILAKGTPDVKMLIRCKEYREQTGHTAKEVAVVIHSRFQNFSRQLLAACESPDKYGVVIHPDALAFMCEHYQIPLVADQQRRRRKSANRKLGRKLTFRMTDTDYQMLVKRVETDGFLSVQAWLYHTVVSILREAKPNA